MVTGGRLRKKSHKDHILMQTKFIRQTFIKTKATE